MLNAEASLSAARRDRPGRRCQCPGPDPKHRHGLQLRGPRFDLPLHIQLCLYIQAKRSRFSVGHALACCTTAFADLTRYTRYILSLFPRSPQATTRRACASRATSRTHKFSVAAHRHRMPAGFLHMITRGPSACLSLEPWCLVHVFFQTPCACGGATNQSYKLGLLNLVVSPSIKHPRPRHRYRYTIYACTVYIILYIYVLKTFVPFRIC
jgi:hypothetical protein